METLAVDQTAVLDEERWKAWVAKGKLREQATARKFKMIAGLALSLLAAGTAGYLLMGK